MSHVEYECDPAYVWKLHSQPSGDLAFDIGANGGMVSAIYAEKFKRIIAFEPCAESFAQLETLKKWNVTPDNRAVSDRDGEIELNVTRLTGALGELTTGDSMVGIWGVPTGTRTIQSTTLDSAAELYGVPDYVKIDTEGHELAILRGGRAVLCTHPRLFVEIHAAENVAPALTLLQPHYKELKVWLHDGYREGDVLAGGHLYLTAGL